MMKYEKPIIVTLYNHQVDENLVHYQTMVMNKYKGKIPFLPFKYLYEQGELDHGDILNKYVHDLFYDMGADCVLFIDVDCVPLNQECIDTTFELAYQNKLVGNIQRSNHLENNKHTYVGSPYICFTKELYESIGCPTLRYTHHGDACEQLTFNCEEKGIEVVKFNPVYSEMPYDDDGNYWELGENMPKYGIGTTYEYEGNLMTYHLFCSRKHKFNQLFYNKCHKIITQ